MASASTHEPTRLLGGSRDLIQTFELSRDRSRPPQPGYRVESSRTVSCRGRGSSLDFAVGESIGRAAADRHRAGADTTANECFAIEFASRRTRAAHRESLAMADAPADTPAPTNRNLCRRRADRAVGRTERLPGAGATTWRRRR